MKILIQTLFILLPLNTFAAGDIELEEATIDLTDNASLHRGVKMYVDYCLGCHSIKHIRYLNLARDFDIPEETILNSITPVGGNIYDKMLTAMTAKDSRKWFGISPPDLSLIGRSRGADWLYTYLKSFYLDPSSPTGANNTVNKDVAMPNMLWQLQGLQEPVIKKESGHEIISKLKLVESGQLSTKEFEQAVNDLVNFLVYAAEPHQLERRRMGKYVLLFIFMFTFVAYLLKKEYWKDVH